MVASKIERENVTGFEKEYIWDEIYNRTPRLNANSNGKELW